MRIPDGIGVLIVQRGDHININGTATSVQDFTGRGFHKLNVHRKLQSIAYAPGIMKMEDVTTALGLQNIVHISKQIIKKSDRYLNNHRKELTSSVFKELRLESHQNVWRIFYQIKINHEQKN